jgi:Ulp1 family protease
MNSRASIPSDTRPMPWSVPPKKTSRKQQDEDYQVSERKKAKTYSTSANTIPSDMMYSSGTNRTTRSVAVSASTFAEPEFVFESVPIGLEEYQRTQQSEFLNDSMIEFAIRYLQKVKLVQQEKQQIGLDTHIFNSFFYGQLTSGPPGPLESPAQMHARVANWTRRRNEVNLFDKRFIVFPMNESYVSCEVCQFLS